MRKLIISAVMMAFVLSTAYAVEPWVLAKRDYEAYQEVRAEAKAAFAAGDYEKAYKTYLELVEMPHCVNNPWVKAWQLNNAAYSLIKSKEDKRGQIDEATAKHALTLLNEAAEIGNKACLVEVNKNIAYCNEILGN